jgi:DNA end-binding protein Ku
MRQTARAGVATMAMRERETLAAVRPYDGVIAVQRLHYADEINSAAPLDVPREAAAPRELRTAIRLIESLAEPFAAQHFVDEYHRRLMSLIEEREEAERVPAGVIEPRPREEGELLAELQASIGAVRETRGEGA